MKFFTPELYIRLQSSNSAIAAKAIQEWEVASARYGRRLDRIRPNLPHAVRRLAYDAVLHDADVASLAREEARFAIALRLSEPHRRIVILIYRLLDEPRIETRAFSARYCSAEPRWLYDEVDAASGRKQFRHNILLSNGWELLLHFRELSIFEADDLLPVVNGRNRSSAMQPA